MVRAGRGRVRRVSQPRLRSGAHGVCGRLLRLLAAAFLAAAAAAGQTLEVRVQDYAGLPRGVWKTSLATASRAFRRAGVEIRWLNCTPDSARLDRRCRTEPPPGTRVLRVLPPEMTEKTRASAIECGRAQLAADGSRGTYASVYWGRVRKLAESGARRVGLGRDPTSSRTKEARLLGYVLAHELAHLLGVHHGSAGVMHGPWSPPEIAAAVAGTLRFQPAEEVRIRRGVLRDVAATGVI